jgi:malonyl CoA-acyl carrier protein transacylase
MSPKTPKRTSPLAVVGASALFPGQPGSAGFWRNILAGQDLIRDVPPTHWLVDDYYDSDPAVPDKTYCKRGGFLSPVEFDSLEFGVTPHALPATDTSQLLALIVARQVLEDATRGQFERLNRDRVSVILGVASGTELLGSMVSRLQRPVWAKALRESGIPDDKIAGICDRIATNYVPWQESTFPGLLGNVVAGRIANRFNLGGTNTVVDAACASSLSALAMAANELHLGQSDLTIVGGVDTLNDILMYMCFSKTPAFSPTGDCRPFSSKADGTILGEGIAMLALRRLEDAERDGDTIYAVIAGLGSSSDGRSKSIYAPVAEGQAKSLRRAYEAAGYGPETVGLVEAHGTGTVAGDAAEFEGLRSVFEISGRVDRQWCALGSVKSQIGHTKAAAGAAGLFKAVMALHHKVLPPTIKIEQPNPELNIETSPFYLNTQTRPWIRHPEYPRRASVSSFGFGGSNFHATLEEYTGHANRAPRLRRTTSELVLFSGASSGEVIQACRDAARNVSTAEQFAHFAHTSQRNWSRAMPLPPRGDEAGTACPRVPAQEAIESGTGCPHPAATVRLAIVAASESDLRAKLEKAASSIEREPQKAFTDSSGIYFNTGPALGGVAFLFPGQGSQYSAMGADLATEFEQAREAWDLAASIVSDRDVLLSDVVFPRPVFSDEERMVAEQKLTATKWAQPAIGAASFAGLRIFQKLGLYPNWAGGHSFGELTALLAAGAIDEVSFLKMARKRGEVMAEAAKFPGTMTAVSGSVDAVREKISASNADVVIANINSPNQCVVSGPVSEMARFEEAISESASFRRLNVATAFHSPIVAPAAEHFREYLRGVSFASPHIPVFSNAEVTPYATEPEAIGNLLAAQISRPVRFTEMIEAMYDSGARVFVEIGPGSVLTGLVKQCLGKRPHLAVGMDRKGMEGVAALWHALAQLSVNGVALDFSNLMGQFQVPPEPRKTGKSATTVKLIGSNYGKPYPVLDAAGNKIAPPPTPPRVKGASEEGDLGGTGYQPVPSGNLPDRMGAASIRNPGAGFIATPSAIPVGRLPTGAGKLPAPPISQTSSQPQPPQAPAPPSADWLRVFQEFQMQTAEVHSAFQRSMTESHLAYLKSMEMFLTGVSGVMPTTLPMPSFDPVPAAPFPMAPTPMPVAPVPMAPAPVVSTPEKNARLDPAVLKSRLLQIVSEKTGYPEDILDLDMELESGLGIDSIKRVEILSAMIEQTPGLPEVNGKEMARLRTLGEVLAHLDNALGLDRDQSASSQITGPSASQLAEPPALSVETLQSRLLEIVSEKTGYPVDILDVNMELESGLGIDSIKRVEILSAMMERTPGLPEVSGKEMARLRTLAEVIGYMTDRIPGASSSQCLSETPALGSTGYQPVPSGNLPDGMVSAFAGNLDVRFPVTTSPIPVGGSPTGAGKLPAPPIFQTGAQSTPPAAPVPPPIQRFELRKADAPAGRMAPCELMHARKVVVVGGDNNLASELARELSRRNIPASAAAEAPADADGVVFLGTLPNFSDDDSAIRANHQAFLAAKTISKQLTDAGGIFITVQDTGGDFGLSGTHSRRAAYAAGASGLVKTAAIEWPKASVKAIDLECGGREPAVLARILADEIIQGGGELEVGLASDGRRTTVENVLSPLGPIADDTWVDSQSILIASGGARGVTAAALIALARATRCRIVLLGRSTLLDEPEFCRGLKDEAAVKRGLASRAKKKGRTPSPKELDRGAREILHAREVRQTLEALQAAGSEALYVPVDIQDERAVRAALEAIRERWGRPTGIIHAAGVLADKRIADKTTKQFTTVFQTKVQGLRTLLEATADDPIRSIGLFSSVAARTGNVGQCDYAMANEVLNKVASSEARRRGGTCIVKSFNWGPWDGGMVTSALKDQFVKRGVPLIPLEAGAQAFVEEIRRGGREAVELVLGGDPRSAFGHPEIGFERTFEVRVDVQHYPEIADHSIDGIPVVPVVQVLSWLLSAARYLNSSNLPARCNDIKVLRGIRLPRFFDEGHVLKLSCRRETNTTVSCEIRNEDGVLHYSGTVELVTEPSSPAVFPALNGSARAWPWSAKNVYEEARLFHGPRFQSLKTLSEFSPAGGSAILAMPAGQRNGAVLDGGLQLLLLWVLGQKGRRSLPTRIGSFVSYRSTEPFENWGNLHCDVRITHDSANHVGADLSFRNETGECVGEFRSVSVHLLDKSDAAPMEES